MYTIEELDKRIAELQRITDTLKEQLPCGHYLLRYRNGRWILKPTQYRKLTKSSTRTKDNQ